MFNFDRNTLIIAVLILITVLALSFLYISDVEIGFLNYLSDLIYNLITPFLDLLHHSIEVVRNFFSTLFSIDEVNQQIKNLKQENSVLKRQVMFLQNIQQENKRLRELLNFEQKTDYNFLGAEVISNSPSVWEKVITINRGSRDGIKERMPVITYNGYLVGRIEEVGSGSSQVRLITDQNFVVGGIIARSDSREIGLVRGSGRSDQPNTIDNISWDADIKENDVVLSSGLSNNFPSGLRIGKITNIENDNYGLSQKADVELFINKITIEEVAVITNFDNEQNMESSN